MAFYVSAILGVVTFYEGFVFGAANAFFNSGAGIHDFILNCIVSFGADFFTSLKTLLETLFDFLEEAVFVSALIGLRCLTSL